MRATPSSSILNSSEATHKQICVRLLQPPLQDVETSEHPSRLFTFLFKMIDELLSMYMLIHVGPLGPRPARQTSMKIDAGLLFDDVQQCLLCGWITCVQCLLCTSDHMYAILMSNPSRVRTCAKLNQHTMTWKIGMMRIWNCDLSCDALIVMLLIVNSFSNVLVNFLFRVRFLVTWAAYYSSIQSSQNMAGGSSTHRWQTAAA